ncbi:MAG: GNAT family N-acetyltransferase [Ruminococcaceae bacterium]|nr:GNAT family N-acetyltransferase [Oscillospiraceae bacterium]
MNIITAEEAKNLLLAYESENAAVLEEIDFMARNAAENEYLTLGNALIIHWLFRGENFTKVCPLGSDWDMDEVLAYLVENRKGSNIQIDVQKSDDKVKSALMNRMSGHFTFRKTYTDYVLTSPCTIEEDPSVRLLTADDRDAFLAMEYTQEQYRPPLSILFDSYVINKVEDGKILAFFEDGNITGSLSFVHQSGAYYDVDYVWTAPSRRGTGIGSRLTAAYIREIQQNGGIPMISNPRTEPSLKIAAKYGFTLNRETFSFE